MSKSRLDIKYVSYSGSWTTKYSKRPAHSRNRVVFDVFIAETNSSEVMTCLNTDMHLQQSGGIAGAARPNSSAILLIKGKAVTILVATIGLVVVKLDVNVSVSVETVFVIVLVVSVETISVKVELADAVCLE
jgi:hypothetical protein